MNQMEAELQQLKEKGIQVDHTAQAAQTEKNRQDSQEVSTKRLLKGK